jgi:hypothetical protein
MTPVKNQGSCGSCWVFGPTAALESYINVYFNQHLDLDLSEQDVLSCSGWGYCGGGSSNMVISDYFLNYGITSEDCFNYFATDLPCSDKCINYNDSIVIISNFGVEHPYSSNRESEIKKAIITHGPLSSGIEIWSHSMALVGYAQLSDWTIIESCLYEDKLCFNNNCMPRWCNTENEQRQQCVNYNEFVSENPRSALITDICTQRYYPDSNVLYWQNIGVIECEYNQKCVNGTCQNINNYNLQPGDLECSSPNYVLDFRTLSMYTPQHGDNYWIFKNSWGEDWGEDGYVKIALASTQTGLGWTFWYLDAPILPPNLQNTTINCVDEDGDGYCNWGISEQMPDTCPSHCVPNKKDCDDSNPDLLDFISETNLNCRYKYQIER